jgi:hypothetical protein
MGCRASEQDEHRRTDCQVCGVEETESQERSERHELLLSSTRPSSPSQTGSNPGYADRSQP